MGVSKFGPSSAIARKVSKKKPETKVAIVSGDAFDEPAKSKGHRAPEPERVVPFNSERVDQNPSAPRRVDTKKVARTADSHGFVSREGARKKRSRHEEKISARALPSVRRAFEEMAASHNMKTRDFLELMIIERAQNDGFTDFVEEIKAEKEAPITRKTALT